MNKNQRPNRLVASNSPYLLQHALNPVDWQEWSPDAFAEAREKNRLVFLSIGYSTCHWCHVMEKESFEDEEVAQLINSSFVPVKVDREQRPDIDHIYMEVCQILTGSGGWPLTLILTPDQKPVFAATYLPKRQKYGRPGLMEILAAVNAAWQSEPEKLVESGNRISEVFQKKRPPATRFPDAKLVELAVASISADYDPLHGGFSSAPKFPMGHVLELLLNHAVQSKDNELLERVEHTLTAMYQGGIFDHVGGGFCRYSTDERWLVPHFEKMLYDNALLLRVYADAFKFTGKSIYRTVGERICEYLIRDMRHADGGFYAAEDADSEGHEGLFYLFDYDEFVKIAGEAWAEHFVGYFNVTRKGNFEGKNILNLRQPVDAYCRARGLETEKFVAESDAFIRRLFAYRHKRIRPSLDDKIITSWNGLAIGALARAGRIFGRSDLIEFAQQAADFVCKKMCAADGELFRYWRNGKAEVKGFFEDYSFLVQGLLELHRSDYSPGSLQRAFELQKRAEILFAGEEPGSYYETPVDGEKLLFRPRNVFDGAIPAARSVFAENYVILAAETGDNGLTDRAAAIFADAADLMSRAPSATAVMLNALRRFYNPPVRVIILARTLTVAETVVAEAENHPGIDMVLVVATNEEEQRFYSELIEGFDLLELELGSDLAIYVCDKNGCKAPVFGLDAFKSAIEMP